MTKRYLCIWFILAGIAAQEVRFHIKGGHRTSIQKYPSMVQVEHSPVSWDCWEYHCAAIIIGERYVLSVAHCFAGDSYAACRRRIRAGVTERGKGGVIVYVERVFNHPSFGLMGFDGDISVVLLANPLVYTAEIKPTSLLPQGTVIPDYTVVVLAGWGAPTDYDDATNVLLHTSVFTINNQLCADRYVRKKPTPVIVTENMICARLLDAGGRDTCEKDSGAPLFLGDSIAGLVSFGTECCNAECGIYPGVYTAVASYTSWIRSIVPENVSSDLG